MFGSADENIQVAKWLIEHRDYKEALKFLNKSIKRKKSIENYQLLADTYLNLYMFDEAENAINSALLIDTNSKELLEKMEAIKKLTRNRGASISDDLNKIEQEHIQLVNDLKRQKANLERKYFLQKESLNNEILEEKKRLEDEHLTKKNNLETEYNQKLNSIEEKKISSQKIIFIVFVTFVASGLFMILKYTYIEKKSKILHNELTVFEGKKSDHQVQLDFEKSKVNALKKNILLKQNELKNMEKLLFEKEKQFSSLEKELQQAQNEIKKEWERINSYASKSNSRKREIDPYKVLNLPRGTNDIELLKKQRRKLGMMCHPDKVSSMHPEIRELAELLMKEVNQAYDLLKNK
jgi:hypothetical protein